MKTIAVIFLSLCFLNAKAQKFQFPLAQDSTILYEHVQDLGQKYSADNLYKTAKTWFVNTFKSSKDVIQSEDAVNGRIIGKGIINLSIKGWLCNMGIVGYTCHFTIQIDVKNNKYRCRVYDIGTIGQNVFGGTFDKSLSEVYYDYLHNKIKTGLMYGKQRAEKNLLDAFTSVDYNIANILKSLNDTMLKGINDDF